MMIRSRWVLLLLLFSGVWQSHLSGADALPTPRKIVKEPTYQSNTPRYGLLVFGKEGKDQVWVVHDEDRLYVDRNGNGDLTEPGECIERLKPRKGFEGASSRTFEVGEFNLGGLHHHGFLIRTDLLTEAAIGAAKRRPEFSEEIKKDPSAVVYAINGEVEVPGIKGGGLNGGLSVSAGPSDADGFLIFRKDASSAPIIRLGGPIQIDFPDLKPNLRPGFDVEVLVSIGFPGRGTGAFTSIGYHETLPAEAKPIVEVEVVSATQGIPPYRAKYELPNRC